MKCLHSARQIQFHHECKYPKSAIIISKFAKPCIFMQDGTRPSLVDIACAVPSDVLLIRHNFRTGKRSMDVARLPSRPNVRGDERQENFFNRKDKPTTGARCQKTLKLFIKIVLPHGEKIQGVASVHLGTF